MIWLYLTFCTIVAWIGCYQIVYPIVETLKNTGHKSQRDIKAYKLAYVVFFVCYMLLAPIVAIGLCYFDNRLVARNKLLKVLKEFTG